jgi:hypothetical protein
MIRSRQLKLEPAAERTGLRRRVRQFYAHFNRVRWDRCHALLDPRLRNEGRVEQGDYAEGLNTFKGAYGSIKLWYVRVSLHLDAASNTRDPRPFAYVYVIWQDADDGFHRFRERWVRHAGHWYTRVAGLVASSGKTSSLG